IGRASSIYGAYLVIWNPASLNVPAECKGVRVTSPDHANVRPSSVLTTTEYGLPSLGRVVNFVRLTLIGPNCRWKGFLRSRSVNENWPSSTFSSSIITSGNGWLVLGVAPAGAAFVSKLAKLKVPSSRRTMFAEGFLTLISLKTKPRFRSETDSKFTYNSPSETNSSPFVSVRERPRSVNESA